MSTKAKFPSGIPYIIGNEAAERFSYYGMKAILTIFMTDYLMMTQPDATSWYHNFGSAVYAVPMIGAIVSDLVFGKYRTILSLSIVYCLGHLVLALFETQNGLFAGLTLIAIGSGGIKPCVSAHVGDQFTKDNKHLIERVFSIFYFSINLGAFVSSLATPILLSAYGPSVAFGIPGALMFLATFVFWLGRNKFVHIPANPDKIVKEFSKGDGFKSLGRLALLYLFVAFFWALFDQTGSTWVLQAKSDFMIKDISLLGIDMHLSASQLQSINPILVMVLIPIFTFVIYPLVGKVIKLTPMRKIGFGLLVGGVSFLIVAVAEDKIAQGQNVSMNYQVWAYLVLTIAEVLVSITALEFSYTQAPNSIKSIVMASYLFSVSLGNTVTSGVNSWMQDSSNAKSIIAGDETKLVFEDTEGLVLGEKIDLKSDVGIKTLKVSEEGKTDTLTLAGTFLVGPEVEGNSGTCLLWDINRKPVSSFGSFKPKEEAWATSYKLSGGTYFRFFAYMIFVVGFVFAVVSRFIKTETHIQGDDGTDPTPGEDLV